MADKETRNFPAEMRAATNDDGVPVVEGTAAVFDQWTDIGDPKRWGWRERIMPGFFDGALEQDVRVLVNHDPNLLLARTKSGTAKLSVTDDGLRYTAEIDPDDPEAMKWHRRIARGDIDGCSFAFTVNKDSWYEDEDGATCRDLMEAGDLYDVGPVTYPAYEQTSVSARAKDTAREIAEARSNDEEPGSASDSKTEEPGSEDSTPHYHPSIL